ncbi:hypothetical protein L208DRAFT_1336242 [Tricholoma matsutake]|nr:hypothetical protein L208DRAFT_1336242 [Tricholoma matsutake 945]
MTKIVNSLSAKMEMGSPMACMYLLGNPDHYTNYRFVPFYWQSYVHKTRNACELKQKNQLQKMAIYKHNGCIIGLLPVQDYKFQPASLHSMCLYNWISSCQREKRATKKKLKHEVGADSTQIRADKGSIDSESNAGGAKAEESSKSQLLPFLADHPLANTHAVQCLHKVCIPNFVGSSLPRFDQGDREYYCSTMLTLFKPWKSGLDLKNNMDSWDKTFSSHSFSM